MLNNSRDKGEAAIILAVIAIPLFMIGCFVYSISTGVGSFGPTKTFEIKVVSKHVDITSNGDGSSSHYMVNTDKGTFEVSNGVFLGVWNADELYGKLLEGKSYKITTEGNRVVGMIFQEYPYITNVTELK